jgi:cation diffusion facilitator family transporter
LEKTIENKNFNLQKWVAVVSIILLAAKFIAYYLTHSVAVLTDALESIVNVAAGFIGLFSLYVAAKPRDKDHPYGHGKAEFLSAAIEGTMILTAGSIIIYTAVKNLLYPIEILHLDKGMLLVGATAVINFVVGFISIKNGKRNNSMALVASGKHLQTDAYSTLGIMVGLFLMRTTGYLWIDSVVAMIFGIVIIYTGYKIIRRSIAGIMDEADSKIISRMVDRLEVNRRVNWVDLHNVRVIKYGTVLHLDCHLTVPWYFNINEAHHEIDELSLQIKNEFGQAIELFVHTDGCLYSQCTLCQKADCPVRQRPFQQRVKWAFDNIQQNKRHQL